MATEQTNANEAKVQVVAEATRVAIQATARAQKPQNTGPKLGRPIIKQPTFDWRSIDKYAELMNFE